MESIQLSNILVDYLIFEQQYYQRIIRQFQLIMLSFMGLFRVIQQPQQDKLEAQFHLDKLDVHILHIYLYLNVK